ncbi:MAG TPA: hypothetical protein VGK52_11970 [Polyangia bacterium]|jgi:hypothetical protein
MGDDSAPDLEIDAEPTGTTQVDSKSHSKTMPHATVDWMVGFDEGRQRGAAEILDALEAALVSVGVGADVAKVIVARVRARAEKPQP